MAAKIQNFIAKWKPEARRTKSPACMVSLEGHEHTDACFIDIAPLSTVEYFQSQGCKSCPPAVPVVHSHAANNPNYLLLTYDVTYFDHAGWKDTFSSAMWDARQKSYAMKWERKGLFTPQVIVDGVPNEVVGADANSVPQILAAAAEAKAQDKITVVIEQAGPDEVAITADVPDLGADVVVVEYDPRPQEVKIGGGDNRKIKLLHVNVVRVLNKVGDFAGGSSRYQIPLVSETGLARAVLVQAGPGGRILASLKLL